MRIYELCLITHNDTTEEQQDQLLQAISEIIARHSGSVLKTEKWGKKNFKYVIKKQSKGHYCFLVFEAAPAALKEIERSIMYNESILRYNFIRLEKFMETPVGLSEPLEPAGAESSTEDENGIEAENVVAEQAAETQE